MFTPGARAYLEEPLFFRHRELRVERRRPVRAGDDGIFAREYASRADIESCFETPAIYRLNAELAKYGETIYYMAVYYLPDLASLNAFDGSGAGDRGYETQILGREDFAGLYTPEWSNALSSKASSPRYDRRRSIS